GVLVLSVGYSGPGQVLEHQEEPHLGGDPAVPTVRPELIDGGDHYEPPEPL
ncbi:hypothetical protein AK812_SmicGene46868, partial [Symbiodinium microadriaticum]